MPRIRTLPISKQLRNNKIQSRTAALYAFSGLWLGALDSKKKKLLSDAAVRVYFALDYIEKKRGYSPGSLLYVTWEEISSVSGINKRSVGEALEKLYWTGRTYYSPGLIEYKKGVAQKRGRASNVYRNIPVPRPPSNSSCSI